MGNERKRSRDDVSGILEDDEYEIEQPMMDEQMAAMFPTSFGKQEKRKDLTSSFAKTKRAVYIQDNCT